ncbi:MAG: tetratricopeptide repeat protein, partial [Nitrospinae bacterium]|nr:tetratricopeptide repeat protein [Nitrospinota bacterium]
MATSSIGHVRHVMRHIISTNPESVLDVGIGFGRWGFLCREMLDAFAGRVRKDQWKVRIEGVEIFEAYLQDHQRYIYDKIHIGDAKKIVPTLGEYGVVIIGDMLEHLNKDDAWGLFSSAMDRSRIGLILNIPIGEGWLRDGVSENASEDHLSWWTLAEFADYKPDTYLTTLMNGMEHASMFITRANYDYTKKIAEGEKAEAEGDATEAVGIYNDALRLVPDREEAYALLAGLYLNQNDYARAESSLISMANACPWYLQGRLLLANLQKA